MSLLASVLDIIGEHPLCTVVHPLKSSTNLALQLSSLPNQSLFPPNLSPFHPTHTSFFSQQIDASTHSWFFPNVKGLDATGGASSKGLLSKTTGSESSSATSPTSTSSHPDANNWRHKTGNGGLQTGGTIRKSLSSGRSISSCFRETTTPVVKKADEEKPKGSGITRMSQFQGKKVLIKFREQGRLESILKDSEGDCDGLSGADGKQKLWEVTAVQESTPNTVELLDKVGLKKCRVKDLRLKDLQIAPEIAVYTNWSLTYSELLNSFRANIEDPNTQFKLMDRIRIQPGKKCLLSLKDEGKSRATCLKETNRDIAYVLGTRDLVDENEVGMGKAVWLTFKWDSVGTDKDGWYKEADLTLAMSGAQERRSSRIEKLFTFPEGPILDPGPPLPTKYYCECPRSHNQYAVRVDGAHVKVCQVAGSTRNETYVVQKVTQETRALLVHCAEPGDGLERMRKFVDKEDNLRVSLEERRNADYDLNAKQKLNDFKRYIEPFEKDTFENYRKVLEKKCRGEAAACERTESSKAKTRNVLANSLIQALKVMKDHLETLQGRAPRVEEQRLLVMMKSFSNRLAKAQDMNIFQVLKPPIPASQR